MTSTVPATGARRVISATRRLLAAAGCAVALAAVASASGEQAGRPDTALHLGVASCAGDNCHGAVEPSRHSRAAQNEYLIWKQKDKHSKAFAVLGEERGRRIAQNLGLGDPQKADLCLDCHADNVPPARRGRQFQLADGVGCESCHGGASGWLGLHLSGAGHAANVAAGLYPIEQPLARAERCLSCHLGDDKRFVTHRIMGAGHPPLGFELATFTALQPAHYQVDADYVDRKGRPNEMQVWAVGQAVEVQRRMNAVLDPEHAPKGIQPELAFFDCAACHRSVEQLQWRHRRSANLDPGRLRLYDASLVMLRAIAARVDREAATRLEAAMLAMHRATAEDWNAVRQAATRVRETVAGLIPQLVRQQFGRDDALAIARSVIASGTDEALHYSAAQQATMALGSIVATMQLLGFAEQAQIAALNEALLGLYEALASDRSYSPERFAEALDKFAGKLPP